MKPASPAEPAPRTLAEARPAASAASSLRRIELGDRPVDYALRRARRRTIGLVIDERGLRVGAPPRATLGEIEALIVKHAAWVLDKLDAWALRHRQAAWPLRDEGVFPLLGTHAPLRLLAGRNDYLWHPATDDAAGAPARLDLRLAGDGAMYTVFERALRDFAQRHFAARLGDYCRNHGIDPPPFRLSNARTRWGSCSRRSGLRLNWRLIHAEPALIDYVVAHELAHLKEMNHTARFWSEVEKLYPDWRAARARLRRFGETMPRFS